jgi:peptidylprolyl isomerase
MKLNKFGWAGIAGAVCVLGLGMVSVTWSESKDAGTKPVDTAAQAAAAPAKSAPVLVAAAATTPAPAAPAASAAGPVAKMGALEVQGSEVDQALRSLPQATRDQLKANRPMLEKLVRAQLAEKALINQAQAQNWGQRPEIKAMEEAATRQIILRTYLDSVSKVPAGYPSDKELQAAYEQAKSQLMMPPMVRISQIFIEAPANNADAVARGRKQAADVAKQAQAPKANFDALVKKYSQDKDAAKGSDTGFLPLGQLLPEMRPVVSKLQKGEVSAPVQSQSGFHILKVVDTRPAQPAPLEIVKDKLQATMRQQRQEQIAQAYLENLLSTGTVSIDGAALNAAVESAH